MTQPITYGHATRLSMEGEPEPDKTVEGERRLCQAVIAQAVHDIEVEWIGGLHTIGDVRSAIRFLLGEDSHFEWMAEGVGLDPGEVRAALAGRIEVAVRRLGR